MFSIINQLVFRSPMNIKNWKPEKSSHSNLNANENLKLLHQFFAILIHGKELILQTTIWILGWLGRYSNGQCVLWNVKGLLNLDLEGHCPRHPDDSKHDFAGAKSISDMLNNPNSFCRIKCGEWLLPCFKPEHRCERACYPKHTHNQCLKPVLDIFPDCGHSVTRKCFQDIEDVLCNVEVKTQLNVCGHWMNKKCHQSNREVRW